MNRLTSFVAVAWLGMLVRDCPAGDEPAARAMLISHLDSLARLKQFTCRYSCSYYKSATPTDAMAGKVSGEPARVGQFLWAKDGDRMSQKIVEDAVTTQGRKSPKLEPVPGQPHLMLGAVVPFRSSEELTDGQHSLGFVGGDDRPTVNIWGQGAANSLSKLPFGCFNSDNCQYAPFRFLQAVDRRQGAVGLSREADGEGSLVKVTITHDPAGPHKEEGVWELWLDPRFGLAPKRVFFKLADGPGNTWRFDYSDYRKCPDDVWFPGRVVETATQRHRSDWIVYDIRVTELDATRRPARSCFEIALPAGTCVIDQDAVSKKGNKFFTKQAETVTADDLPRLYQMAQTIPHQPRADTAITSSRSYGWVWGGVGASVLVVVVLALRRRY